MTDMTELPLKGIRVIDSTYVLAGPYAGGILTDLGAEVIKIEGPGRPDSTRGGTGNRVMPDNVMGADPWNRPSTYNMVNRGKKSLVVDLTRKEGRDVLIDLIKVSDVFVENFTPRVMRGWGLDYPNMKAINPNIVLVSNTGYGRGGPFSSYPAQATTQEATHGLAAVTGYIDGEPSRAGQSYVDFLATWSVLTCSMLGLRYRNRFGRGMWADIGMYQLGCYNVSDYVLDWIANRTPAKRIGNRHRHFAPQGCYRCAGDDAWCTLSVRDDTDWAALCGVIGRTELARDERYATEPARRANHDDIDGIISQWTRNLSKLEVMERLQAAGVPAGAVLDGRDLHFDPHLKARGFLEMLSFPEERDMGARRPIIGRPWRFSKLPLFVRAPAPKFGQHNREVIREILGYDESRYQALEAAGVIAQKPTQVRLTPDLSLDERVRLGRLAYWDSDYKERLGIA